MNLGIRNTTKHHQHYGMIVAVVVLLDRGISACYRGRDDEDKYCPQKA
jgi:hypothetical protein